MDVYVQEFGAKKTHDEFYTNKNIRKAFYKYVRFIVSRYANEPGIIAWELANDAECASTLPSSDQCNTNTLTRWYAETAKFIRSIDCNHLIASGYLLFIYSWITLLNLHSHQGLCVPLSKLPQVIPPSASTEIFPYPRKSS
jgi:endo-1,4-beta-mannosidase